jgi:hypothetical protein
MGGLLGAGGAPRKLSGADQMQRRFSQNAFKGVCAQDPFRGQGRAREAQVARTNTVSRRSNATQIFAERFQVGSARRIPLGMPVWGII